MKKKLKCFFGSIFFVSNKANQINNKFYQSKAKQKSVLLK